MAINFDELNKNLAEIIRYNVEEERDADANLLSNINEETVSKITEKWYLAKYRFYRLFNENLIYEYPQEIEIILTDSQKQEIFDRFVDSIRYNNTSFTKFLEQNEKSFFDNIVTVPPANSNITCGTKLVKSFKFFFKDEELERYQNLASRVIQQNKIKGHLCLSIHPLDFLSISENTYNWRSCHALDGDYRAGNLSYMCDSSTIVAYLKADSDAVLPHFPNSIPWNNKKWRMLLHFNQKMNLVYYNKPYPFSSNELLLQVHKLPIMQKLGYAGEGADYLPQALTLNEITMPDGTKSTLNSNYLNCCGNLMSMAELCPTPKEGLLYNDLAFSCNYTPYVAWTSTFYHGGHSYSYPERDLKKKFRVPVGASVPCPCGCGYDLDLSEKLVCELCSEYELAYCATCGSFIPRNEVWVLDDETYCKDCYDMIMNQEKEYY